MTFTVVSSSTSAVLHTFTSYVEARRVPDSYIVVQDPRAEFTLDTHYLDRVVGYGTSAQREPTMAEVRGAFFL